MRTIQVRKRAGGAAGIRYQKPQTVRKSQPTASQVHVNVPLTNMSVGYMLNPSMFIASRAFAHVPVLNQSNVYYRFQKDDFWRDEAKPRVGASETAGGGFNIDTDSYSCQTIGYHKDITDAERTNADTVLALDSVATQFVTQKMLIRKEKQWVNSFFKTGVWANEVAGVAAGPVGAQFLRWDVNGATQSDPQADVLAARITVITSTGQDPRHFIINPYVYKGLQLNTKIQQRFQYTTPESITTAMLAGYFDVDDVLVAYGVEATNVEGATAALSFVTGKHALLCYKTQSPGLMMPTAGYVMTWNAYAGSQSGASITKFRMQHLRADRVEGEFAYDMKVVAPDCGYFFLNAVS